MPEPIVSVIIPTYNSGQYLCEAIDSVFEQTYHNFEILVIDDGSEDNTPELVGLYGDRVQYMRQENAGPSRARNRGILASKGSYTAFLDADDIWLPRKLEKQIELLRKAPDAALIYSGFTKFDIESDEEVSVLPENISPKNMFDRLLADTIICLSTVVIRTLILKEIGGFEESLKTAEDTHLYLRIARNHKLAAIPEILVRRRKHKNNLSNQIDAEVGTLDCLDRIVRMYPSIAPNRHPPLRKAYFKKGKQLMMDYFFAQQYQLCNNIAKQLLKLGWMHPQIAIFFLLTLFPQQFLSSFFRMIREFRQT